MVKSLFVIALLAFSAGASAQVKEIDATSALVLSLGSTPAKTAQLMTGANSLKVTVNEADLGETVEYTFTSQKCESGVIFVCKDLATLVIRGDYVNQGELSRYEYSSGAVTVKAQGQATNPKGYRCLQSVNCMPIVSPSLQKYCSADYKAWAQANCESEPSFLN